MFGDGGFHYQLTSDISGFMSSKLTVVFYIILCLEAGVVLTVLPWIHPFGLGDWGDNFFLLYASQKIGLQGLQDAVSSGWARGAVTGLGLINLAMASWEIAHFRQTVRTLDAQGGATTHNSQKQSPATTPSPAHDDAADVARTENTPSHLPDHERRDDARDHS